jgi:Mrp family chromosome partitioning ATPase
MPQVGEPSNRTEDFPPLPSTDPALNWLGAGSIVSQIPAITLNAARLESRRIISYDVADQRSKSFDVLRTQVLQEMDRKHWQILAVTSPTAGCGKTLTAINLALSIARQPERAALLVDMDLRKPQVARRLGINCEEGLVGVLESQSNLSAAMVRAQIGRHEVLVLPAETTPADSSECMASRAMREVLATLKRDFRPWTVILDLPPMLLGDDVLAVLPLVDCALLVTAVGTTTTAEVEECNRYLQSTSVVRVVVNKVPDWNNRYY